jgi:2-oxoisovalerate dehydrogenase E2 component (dihydrolipoyl transacylase)
MQRAMFKNMTKSLSIPHLLYTDEITMDACAAARASINASLTDSSPVTKISYLPIVAKALAIAARFFPVVNSSIAGDPSDISSLKLVHHLQLNLSFALDTPQGLQVPIIKGVESMSVIEIAAEMERLRDLGAQGKLGRQDTEGGTMTLSNIGNVGGGVVMPVCDSFAPFKLRDPHTL